MLLPRSSPKIKWCVSYDWCPAPETYCSSYLMAGSTGLVWWGFNGFLSRKGGSHNNHQETWEKGNTDQGSVYFLIRMWFYLGWSAAGKAENPWCFCPVGWHPRGAKELMWLWYTVRQLHWVMAPFLFLTLHKAWHVIDAVQHQPQYFFLHKSTF